MKTTQLLGMGVLLSTVGWSAMAAAQGAPSVGTAPVMPAPPAVTAQTPPQPVGPVYQVQPGQTVYVQPPANGQPGAPIYVQPAQPVQPAAPYAQPYDPNQPVYMQPGQQPVYVAPPPMAPLPRQVVRYDLQPRYGLIIGGAVMLGVSWLIHSGTAAIAEAVYTATEYPVRTMWTNYIPVLGPWLTMTTLPNDAARGLSMTGLAFSGLVQGTGLALLIVGAASRQRVPVYAWNSRIQLTPSIGPTGTGLALSGNF